MFPLGLNTWQLGDGCWTVGCHQHSEGLPVFLSIPAALTQQCGFSGASVSQLGSQDTLTLCLYSWPFISCSWCKWFHWRYLHWRFLRLQPGSASHLNTTSFLSVIWENVLKAIEYCFSHCVDPPGA